MAVKLSPEQRSVVRRALRTARQMGASPRETKALVTALAVESNYQHDKYARVGSGDRDSVGALQQRPSQGWGPAGESLETDVKQFLRAARKANTGRGSAGQLAQAVQRSAFPDRYDQRGGEAASLIRANGGSSGGSTGGGGSNGGSAGTPARTETTVTGAGFNPGDVSALAALAQQAQPKPQAPISAPQGPQFSAQAVMPQGYQAPSAQPIPQSQGSSLTDLLSQIGSSGQSIPQVDVQTRSVEGTDGRQSGSSGGGSGGKKGVGGGLVSMVQATDALAERFGVPVTAKQEPGHASGGDHDPAVKGASARDYGGDEASRERLFRQITRRLGIKNAKYKGSDINVVKNGVRWQIISRDHGTGPHLHVGWRDAR